MKMNEDVVKRILIAIAVFGVAVLCFGGYVLVDTAHERAPVTPQGLTLVDCEPRNGEMRRDVISITPAKTSDN